MPISRPLAVLLTVAAATTALSATSAAPASAAPAGTSLRVKVLKLTNAERVRAGCPKLTANAALAKAAQRHSVDMAAHEFVDHTGSNGSTLVRRAENAGYTGWSALAENVAGGQRTAAAVVKSWMRSPGHRANILNCSLKHLGVGYAKKPGTEQVTYWTQNFGSKF
ncbi:CAP domain-containing protein [Streptomyces sp. BH-SS-21]|uniref:CAP domain-containing protein n=1 Tax=Streptomyces liliiviolaceus TaxID=2823109 RepID=A0A940XZD2_9ACTN|nr:CAP domain-containing protein [Streptomyces liliiviolaceus]MBQ0849435.1 CAP domain-containing protein [Streptomyces liliiviolaceus]